MGLELYFSHIISASIKLYHLWKDEDDKLDLARIEASVWADQENKAVCPFKRNRKHYLSQRPKDKIIPTCLTVLNMFDPVRAEASKTIVCFLWPTVVDSFFSLLYAFQ